MTTPSENVEPAAADRIRRFLARVRPGLAGAAIEPLVGDASTRAYYRVRAADGTYVLALLPEPFEPDRLAFLNVAELFGRIPVRVPRVEAVSGPEGALLLEDLGDDLLQTRAARARPHELRRLYAEAVDILVRLQRRGEALRDERYAPYRIAFDEPKLLAELAFFEEHFLRGLRGARPTNEEREVLRRGFGELARRVAARPRVLCHRDYHARNLLVTPNGLAVIDFQDARLGPASYDLVSLLRDSYVELADELVDEMRERFARARPEVDLEAELEDVALQRSLKALGTFGYQIAVRGKEVYRQYVPRTLGLVRRNFEGSPRFDPLRRVLARHLPELA